MSSPRIYAASLALCLAGQLGGCSGSDSDNSSAFSEPSLGPTDTTAPVITLNGNETIEVAFGAVYGDLGASAVDDVDGEVAIATEGSVDTQISGEYEIAYSASDASGNTGSRIRTVVVLEDPLLTAEITTPSAPAASAFFDGVLIEADYWTEEPQILSAGLGFADIVGVDAPAVTFDLVRDAGGAWRNDIDCGDDLRNYTTVSTRDQVAQAYITQSPYGPLKDGALGIDGLPIVFSWPVDTRTLNLSDFQFTLSTGDIVRPMAVSPFPNVENNERNTVVVFGEFGNRFTSGNPDSRFPIRLEIVEDDTPLLLVGPEGQTASAVGLTWETSNTPYNVDGGPRLVGAKLNRINGPRLGDGVRTPLATLPGNDASTLYSEGDFVLRMLTSGGFSPNGVTAVRPDEFERYFRIRATGVDGDAVLIENVGEEYDIAGGTIRVVGLADLGAPEGGDVVFDACYNEDADNYIDIILVGDEAAARNITHLELPGFPEGYSHFFNPGGPGGTPFDGVFYTQAGVTEPQPVTIALDDPMRVTYNLNIADTPDPQDIRTIDINGVTREYLLTVPEGYAGSEPVPLLFNFHGLGSNAQQQLSDSGLATMTERENVILVTPQAVGGVWTVTGFPISNDADDFGFVSGLIDELNQSYNVDADRIYATGMSQGAFLAFDLACNFSDIFAAIAPVSGAMSPPLQEQCAPQRPVPVLQTHGTADDQIPYDVAHAAIDWWVGFNNTSEQPEITLLPDPFPENGTTVESWVYENAGTGVNVEHFRINGGGHVWPGSEGDSDIEMAEEIWRFLSRYDLDGLIAD